MTTPIDGNDPAFPRATTMNPVTGQPWNDEQPGVPIRALLAGMALQGLLQHEHIVARVAHQEGVLPIPAVAKRAIEVADALIAELNK